MNSIIHFTDLYSKLESILTESAFRLKYCKERFDLGENIASNAVHPMVSFSEYVIGTINNKTITYGRYGIGLKKSWVKKNKLHPVLYIDKHSNLAQALSDLLIARRKNAERELAPHVRLSIMTIKCFTKNARGYNSYFKIDNFNFKAEKEWRYVPTKSTINGNLISQSRKKYEASRETYNDKLKKFPLEFKREDIEYIFVKTESEKEKVSNLFGIPKTIIKISNWKTELLKN